MLQRPCSEASQVSDKGLEVLHDRPAPLERLELNRCAGGLRGVPAVRRLHAAPARRLEHWPEPSQHSLALRGNARRLR